MSKVTFEFPAGIQVEDKISGLKGVLTSRCQRINGCRHYFIQPRFKDDGTEVPGHWTDGANIEVLDWKGKEDEDLTVDFAFETGDRVENRLQKREGIISVRRIDSNGCVAYWYEPGEQTKEGKPIELYGFETEFSLKDRGLNAPTEQPLQRRETGCFNNISK